MPSALLFLCVANSARSQLAEAIGRHMAPELDFYSAGSQPGHVRHQVRVVLDEVGIGHLGLRSKALVEVPLDEVGMIVTLCREEQCPWLPGDIARQSWALPDPVCAPQDERLQAFRDTRDELMRRMPRLLAAARDADPSPA